MTNTTEHNGREYTITGFEEALPALKADLIARGFDGNIYTGESIAKGRQRRDYHGQFLRSAKSGRYVSMI